MQQKLLETCSWNHHLQNGRHLAQTTLQWRHNDHDGGSNQQPHDCLLNRLFRRRSKKTSKLRVTGLCVGNSPVTGEFPAQRASNAENVSIWCRLHTGMMSLHYNGLWQHSVCRLQGTTHVKPEQNGRHFLDDIFICIFLDERFCILIRMSVKLVSKSAIENQSALV